MAYRGAIMYFCVRDFNVVDPMYQYSLQWFTNLFVQVRRKRRDTSVHRRVVQNDPRTGRRVLPPRRTFRWNCCRNCCVRFGNVCVRFRALVEEHMKSKCTLIKRWTHRSHRVSPGTSCCACLLCQRFCIFYPTFSLAVSPMQGDSSQREERHP